MANMAYCRFENTTRAFKDCLEEVMEAIDEGMSLKQFRDSLSLSESDAFDQLMSLAEDIIESKAQFEYNEGMKDIV
jgi:hypothetical protein